MSTNSQWLKAAYLEAASETDSMAELCSFVDYDPDIGRVPEHWEPRYLAFVEKVIAKLQGAKRD